MTAPAATQSPSATPARRLVHQLGKRRTELARIRRVVDAGTFARYVVAIVTHAGAIARTGTLEPADLALAGHPCVFHVLGKRIVLDGRWFGLAREIYCRRVYSTVPGFELGPDDTVVDLGAHVGVFTTMAALLCRRVLAVEPQAFCVAELRANVARNGCGGRVVVERGLVGSGSGLFADARHYDEVFRADDAPPRLALADVLARHDVDSIDFMKIDVEGSEFALLADAPDWLRRVRRVVMEVHLDFGDVHALRTGLETAGFRVWLVDDAQHVTPDPPPPVGYLFARRE